MPLGDSKVLDVAPPVLADLPVVEENARERAARAAAEKSPAAIQFVRNRLLYARPVLNSRGVVTFGLRHIRK